MRLSNAMRSRALAAISLATILSGGLGGPNSPIPTSGLMDQATGAAFQVNGFRDPYRDAFDRWDAGLNGGLGYSNSNNLLGYLAWKESYIMSAYATMYRATRDIRYLNSLATHAENVIDQRDDNKGRQDYRGVIGPTWVSTAYGNGSQPIAWVVHSGLITYPMADFAYIVINDSGLWNQRTPSDRTYIDMAHYLRDEVAKTIAAHSGEWDDSVGSYRFPDTSLLDFPGDVIPLNMSAAMGRTLVTMYLVTGNPDYLHKTIALALHFKGQLRQPVHRLPNISLQDDWYEWNYWPDGGEAEDISHGSLEADFAHLCFSQGIVFDQTDMTRLARTLTEGVYVAPLRIAKCVDGTENCKQVTDRLRDAARWAHLHEFDRDTYHILVDYFIEKVTSQDYRSAQGPYFLAVAELVLHRDELVPIAVNRAPGSNSRWAGVAAGDFDDDGVDEFVAVRNYDGDFYMYQYHHGSIIQLASFTAPGSNSRWAGVAAGDFDDDGTDEFVAIRNYDGNFYMYKYRNGTISQMASYTLPGENSRWAGVAAGDFDNDGTDEFVAVRNYDGNFYMYQYQNGSITQLASFTAPGSNSRWAGVAAGDFDDDGTDEFVAVRNYDGNFYMYKYRNGTIAQIASYTLPGENSEWTGITAGEFAGDGREEFLAARNYDGDMYMYDFDGGRIRQVSREFFPKDLENSEVAAGSVRSGEQAQDDLIMLRNYDGDAFILSSDSNLLP